MTARDRVPCMVPFCRRTISRKSKHDEFLCADHWRAVPTRLRRLKTRAYARWRRTRNASHLAFAERTWQRCVMAAVSEAAGVGGRV